MQLRIREITRTADDTVDSTVDSIIGVAVEFVSEELELIYEVEEYRTVVSNNLRQDIAWYYSDYALEPFSGTDRSTPKRLIAAGRAIGDQLAGENQELLQVQQLLCSEERGELSVRVEGCTETFLQEPWELLILHDSDQLLSCVASSFVRVVTDPTTGSNTSLSAQDSLPLKADKSVMFMVSPTDTGANTSCCLAHIWSAMQAGYATPVSRADSLAQLREELERQPPLRAFHYEGPVLNFGKGPCIRLPGNTGREVTVRKFAETLVQSGIQLLALSPVGSQIGIAAVIAEAGRAGLLNVVTTNFLATPAITRMAFSRLYLELQNGVSLEAALGAVRSSLLEPGGEPGFGLDTRAPQLWPVLTLYSHRRLVFEDSGSPDKSTQDCYQLLHRLHGFRSRMLPPLKQPAVDPPGFGSRAQRAMVDPLVVCGPSGAGKTQYAHWLALYLVAGGGAEQAFYFDLAQPYQPMDMAAMLGTAMGLGDTDGLDTVLDKLSDQKSLFVFDNDDAEVRPIWLGDLLADLQRRGHGTLLASRCPRSEPNSAGAGLIELGELSCGQKATLLAAATAASPGLAEVSENSVRELLEACQGNPWVLEQMLPHLAMERGQDVVDAAQDLMSADSLSGAYFNWRWSKLSRAAQRLLVMASTVQGLLLDMLQILDQDPALAVMRDELFTDLDTGEITASGLLEELSRSGLLAQYPHGRLLADDFSDQLLQQAGHLSAALRLTFARGVTVTVGVLSDHLQQQPSPSVLNNILLNRRSWAQQLELLWDAGEYRQVWHVRQSLDRLLSQYHLEGESSQWLESLFLRTSAPAVGDIHECQDSGRVGEIVSWFRLAAECARRSESLPHKLRDSAESWKVWLLESEKAALWRLPMLAVAVAGFLQHLAARLENWQQALAVIEGIAPLLQEQEALGLLVENYQLAVRCCHQLGLLEQAERYEHNLLQEIDYESAPAGTIIKQYLFLISQNIKSRNYTRAKALLEEVKMRPDAEPVKEVISDFCEKCNASLII